MAFKEGNVKTGGGSTNRDVIYNDSSFSIFDGKKGAISESRVVYDGIVNGSRLAYDKGLAYRSIGPDGEVLSSFSPTNAFKLIPIDADSSSDNFGWSVAVGSGFVCVGTPGDDDRGSSAGAVYLFDQERGSLTYYTKLIPATLAAGDNFGYSVAAGNYRVVVGAPGDDDDGNQSGSVFVFHAAAASQLVKLTAGALGAAGDNFGHSVAINCNRIVVGAPYDDDKGTDSGSVYIYKLNGTLVKKITDVNGSAGDNFGFSVAVNCGRIIVGAPYDDDNGSDSGSAFIYDLDGNFIKKLSSSSDIISAAAGDNFGYSVAIGSSRIIIGAPNKNYLNHVNEQPSHGAAFSFDLNGTFTGMIVPSVAFSGTSTQYAAPPTAPYTTPSPKQGNGLDSFAHSVAVGDGIVVSGAPYTNIDSKEGAGSAYMYSCFPTYTLLSTDNHLTGIGYSDKKLISLYDYTIGGGTQVAYLPDVIATINDNFGYSVACGWNLIVIGCPYENSATKGVDCGGVYVFRTTERSTSIYEQILDAYGKED
jgi:hypothetical protein